MAEDTFKIKDGSYNITLDQKPQFLKYIREKLADNNNSKAGIVTKVNVDGEANQVRNRGSTAKPQFNLAKTSSKIAERNLRNDNLKISSSHLSKDKLAKFKNQALQINKQGLQADHVLEAQTTGPMIRQLNYELKAGLITKAEYVKRLALLKKQGIGNDPKNLQKLTGKENSEKAREVAKKNKALEKLEKKQTSGRYGRVKFSDIFKDVKNGNGNGKNGNGKNGNGNGNGKNGRVKINGGYGSKNRRLNSDFTLFGETNIPGYRPAQIFNIPGTTLRIPMA